jgi:hypothetical protein
MYPAGKNSAKAGLSCRTVNELILFIIPGFF